eukprot:Rhum_TRINITY_DN8574_c0_g1::Rhum_TRINITY_DN8574_c0_g1_i2::g.28506::m.28506
MCRPASRLAHALRTDPCRSGAPQPEHALPHNARKPEAPARLAESGALHALLPTGARQGSGRELAQRHTVLHHARGAVRAAARLGSTRLVQRHKAAAQGHRERGRRGRRRLAVFVVPLVDANQAVGAAVLRCRAHAPPGDQRENARRRSRGDRVRDADRVPLVDDVARRPHLAAVLEEEAVLSGPEVVDARQRLRRGRALLALRVVDRRRQADQPVLAAPAQALVGQRRALEVQGEPVLPGRTRHGRWQGGAALVARRAGRVDVVAGQAGGAAVLAAGAEPVQRQLRRARRGRRRRRRRLRRAHGRDALAAEGDRGGHPLAVRAGDAARLPPDAEGALAQPVRHGQAAEGRSVGLLATLPGTVQVLPRARLRRSAAGGARRRRVRHVGRARRRRRRRGGRRRGVHGVVAQVADGRRCWDHDQAEPCLARGAGRAACLLAGARVGQAQDGGAAHRDGHLVLAELVGVAVGVDVACGVHRARAGPGSQGQGEEETTRLPHLSRLHGLE